MFIDIICIVSIQSFVRKKKFNAGKRIWKRREREREEILIVFFLLLLSGISFHIYWIIIILGIYLVDVDDDDGWYSVVVLLKKKKKNLDHWIFFFSLRILVVPLDWKIYYSVVVVVVSHKWICVCVWQTLFSMNQIIFGHETHTHNWCGWLWWSTGH